MNKKSLLLLLVAALVTGLAAMLANRKPGQESASSATRGPGSKLLADVDPSRLAALSIQNAEAKVTVKRGEGDVWAVVERDGFTADTSRLSGVIKDLFDVKIVQAQEAGPSQYGRLQLANPAESSDPKADKDKLGTVVRLYDEKETLLAEVVLGKAPESAGQDPMAAMMGGGGNGKFVRLGADAARVFLVSNALYQATASPADWIEKGFFQPGTLKRVVVTGPQGFEGWEVAREKSDGTFALKEPPAGKQLSASTASSLGSLLTSAQAADVLTKAEVDGLDKAQTRVISLESFDGMVHKLSITPLAAKEGEGANYAVAAEVSGTYVEPAPAEGAKKPADMNEEEKKADAAAKEAARKTWEQNLAKQQALAKRVFKVNSYTIDSIWKARADVLEDIPKPAEPAAPAAGTDAPPAGIALPTDGAASAPAPREPVSATTEPISVTTPPIEVTAPPADKPAAPPAEEPKE